MVEDFGKLSKKPMRDGYGEAMVEVARKDPRIVALVADLLDSLKLESFKKESASSDNFFCKLWLVN